ncbi:DUF4440 domain-containing protein [Candidatus Binatia bacterium]|nr:DUF4440 domain-containing protein [Candidatus Binatia bacterium]
MPDETPFTRRICAVLLADVTGFSALMGKDDERTARAVHRLQQVVQDIVAEAGGRAEPCAGDAIFATFDSVVGAVAAALGILRRLDREQFEGQHLKLRIGIHVGDVLTRDGAAFGDAINIAARLQAVARPGSICVSETVYRQVRNRFDDQFVSIGRQNLKNISDQIQAYLILPRDVAVGHNEPRYRRPLLWGGAVAAVVATVAAGALLAVRDRSGPTIAVPAGGAGSQATVRGEADSPGVREDGGADLAAAADKVVLGVMGFKGLGGGEGDDWRREALRDGLNTQLSQLSQVKVYSKEFIDFLISRKGLSEIEAAKDLGIAKMVSGSFVVVRDELKIETHVVDVDTGVLEASYETAGQAHEFLALQNQLALGLIARLDIPITDAERRLLAQRPSSEDALRMLLEAEGQARPAATPAARGPGIGRPVMPPSAALAAVWPFAARSARADDVGQAAILAALESYRAATEARDLARLAAVYNAFPPEQQAAQQRYFDNVRDLKVTIENPEIAIVGDEAVVSYTRTDDFVDARTGRPMHVSVRLTKIMVRDDGKWRLAPGK